MQILAMLKSIYCWFVFIFISVLGYFFVISPYLTEYSPLYIEILAYVFLFLFSLSFTCMIFNIKNIVKLKKGSSLIALLGYIIGFASLQTCFVSGICVTGIGIPLLSSFLPVFLQNLFEELSIYILLFSLLMILISIYYMDCFNLKNINLR